MSTTYAAKHALKVGSKLDLNGTSFTVVGLVSPPLGGQSADVYLPLKQLQTLANADGARERRARARGERHDVVEREAGDRERRFRRRRSRARRRSPTQISGSLVDASNLSHDLGFALSVIAAVAAFLLAALLALSSVGKRVRELGTLKALGWTQRMVVRQIAGESLAQGVLGGIFGIVLGVAALHRRSAPSGRRSTRELDQRRRIVLGLGAATARTATSSVSLDAPVGLAILAIGFGLALLGGLIAGTAGAMRAARLRPADALRQVE